jgi:hypothetical protein
MSDREELLEETPPDALRAFLAREFEADSDLERRFNCTVAVPFLKERTERSEVSK